jgi:hypothetical protein
VKKNTAPKKKQDSAAGEINTLFGRVAVKTEEVVRTKEASPFDFVNDISFDKSYIYQDSPKSFKPFLINKALSVFPDCLHSVAFLNANHGLSEKMQHDYLFYSLPKRKRFKKDGWLKKSAYEKEELQMLEDVALVVGYNLQRTKQFWSMLTAEQQTEFLKKYVYHDQNNHYNK